MVKKIAIALVVVGAALWLLHAMSAGELYALLAKADALDDAGRHEEALVLYRQAAAMGEPYALNAVGLYFHKGRGVEQDYAEAMRWYQRAAAKGYGTAMYNIAGLHHAGSGVEKNYDQALHWYHKALDAGERDAIVFIAQMHAYGQGVPQSQAEALVWYRKGMAAGDLPCTVQVGLYLVDGLAGERQLEEALRVFEDLYKRHRDLQFALRQWQCLQDLGRTVEAYKVIDAAERQSWNNDWFDPIARYVKASGTGQERELDIWVARGEDTDDRAMRHCAAEFYKGLKWLHGGEPLRGREALERAAAVDTKHPARRSARAALARMEEPGK